MTRTLMDSYIHMMRNTGCDDRSREQIMGAVELERQRASIAHSRTHKPRRTFYTLAAAACAGPLVLGATAYFPRLTHSGPGATPGLNASGFVLAAYAQGNPVEGSDGTAVTTNNLFVGPASWSEGDDGTFTITYAINPELMGDNVASVEYRSTNENVLLEGWLHRPGEQSEESSGSQIASSGFTSSFTVGGPNASLADLAQLDMRVTVARNDAISDLVARINAGAEQETLNQLRLELEKAAAQELASGTLEIKATLADGSTQTHEYRIVPVDSFEQKWQADRDAWEQSLTSGGTEYSPEQLYILEQVK